MAQDQQTYKRAAHAALIGLGVQLVLAVTLALVGLYADSPAIHAATWHFFGGLPIWAILWILYHQHQLERIEAMEAEQFAQSDARAAALFDEAGAQLHVARRRLENLGKWWLPGVSVFMSLYLLAVGGSLLYLNYQDLVTSTGQLDAADAIAPRGVANAAMVSIVLVALGFVAFLVARYVAGMTRERDWTLLRGGASYLMGGVVLTILLFAGAIGVWMGNLTLLAVLALVIPGLMVLLGLEMALGFLFGLYRPRRPGEINRPAFDSRTLGLLTRPESIGKILNETINYQFGFEVSRSWFYRLLSRAITPLIVVGVLVLVLLTTVVVVAPHQGAVITTFGAYSGVVGPGPHLKWPWPISRAEKYDVNRVHQVVIGSEPDALRPGVPILWTNQHAESAEEYLVTAPSRYGVAEGEAADTVSAELTGARLVVKYRISDLEEYVQGVASPSEYLERLAMRRVNTYLVSHTIDELLTQGRREAGDAIREQLQADIAALPRPLGLEVVFVGFDSIHPPQDQEVASKFHEMIDARQERAAAAERAQQSAIGELAEVAGSREMALEISNAIVGLEQTRDEAQAALARGELTEEQAQAIEQEIARHEVAIEQLLDSAGGRAAQMIYEARAYRWQRALGERGRLLRLNAQYDAYRQAPEYFRKRTFLETLAETLPDRRKTVIVGEPDGRQDIRFDFNTESNALGNIFGEE